MTRIYFSARPEKWLEYQSPLRSALGETGISFHLAPTFDDPEKVDYIVYDPKGPLRDFTPFINAKAVLALWAGVEGIVNNPTLTQPLARMVDSGLSEGMAEWVTGQVLRHHLGLDEHICRTTPEWQPNAPPLARDRKVAILGLGALGQACAKALSDLNFDVSGWSRNPKKLTGIKCYSGDAGLQKALRAAEILVLLLPLTQQTENVLDSKRLAQLPKGAVILNPGRGGLIDDGALLAALDSGQIGHATLDVFRTEPLPTEHPYWAHPKVTVTPHIASETRPESASRMIAENIRRGENGEPFLNLVDRGAGY